MSIELYWPLLLLPLPLLVYRYLPPVSKPQAALRVPFFRQLQALQSGTAHTRRQALRPLLCLAVLWVGLVLACCRPVLQGEPVAMPTAARDLLLAVDISGSMDERDMLLNQRPATRLQMVKHVLSDFIERRKGDRLGLVLFADHAYLQAPLTFDTQAVKQLLLEAQLGFAGQKTAIGDAIGVSIKRLLERPAQSRTLILLTDGANNAGQVAPLEAGTLAAEQGIRIYTIGIGSEQANRPSIFGRALRRNLAADLDEKTLRRIAEQSGGQYFRATSRDQLAAIYSELDKLEPVAQQAQSFRPVKQLYYWPLSMAALALLALLLQQPSLRAAFMTRARSHTGGTPGDSAL
ncbi:MAG: VWA domain-containing protein [Pseudomonadales bacterium]|nr:VWA domain-containing protein [Gammaproteobacteria bacterium]NNL56417.1 VWA domain-containing protein [Pseudomonadales bacterium]